MNAPLLILFDENGTHTVHAFPNMPAHRARLTAEETHAQAKGLKLTGGSIARPRNAFFYVTHPANQPARMPTGKEVRAILKKYREAQR